MFSSSSKMSSLHRLLSRPISLPSGVKNISPNSTLKFCIRKSSGTAPTADGGTYVTILNKEREAPIMIDGYSTNGFRLNNGLFVVGPVALFPRSILSWNIASDEDINESSLSLFLHLSPKLDVLVIGLSDARNQKMLVETRTNIYNMMKNYKRGESINIEVLPTEKAVTTYNFLNHEKRFVGAALLPPTHYTPTLDDEYRTAYLTKKKEDGDFIGLTE